VEEHKYFLQDLDQVHLQRIVVFRLPNVILAAESCALSRRFIATFLSSATAFYASIKLPKYCNSADFLFIKPKTRHWQNCYWL